MINLFKKVKNLLPSSEKAWYTLGQLLIGGVFVYIAVDIRNKSNSASNKKIDNLMQEFENSDLEKSPSMYSSPTKLSKFLSASSKKVLKIVIITGGPCSGKTTALNNIAEALRNRGFKVYLASETAGILHAGGANMQIEDYPELKQIKFQGNLLQLQMAIEDRITEVAMVECTDLRPGVILCDRGTMDGAAFISKERFQAILNKMGENIMNIRDNRYDGIIHLVTVANGAPEFFKNQNSEQAIQIDNLLQEAWKAHPQFYKINNFPNQSFEAKMERAIKTALHLIGIPSSVNFYKKFLLKSFEGEKGILELLPKELLLEQTQIQDIFLQTSGKQIIRKIRKRGYHECCSYMIIEKVSIKSQKAQIKRRINSKNYYQMIEEKDELLNPIKKTRSSFLWKGRYFLIDEYKLQNGTKFSVLLIFIEEEENDSLSDLPSFLKIGIVREITNEEQYLPESIAKKDWKMPEEDFNSVNKMFSL